MDVLGVASDLDILIEFPPHFLKKAETLRSVSSFINRLGENTEHSALSRTYFTVADVREYKTQIARATNQGGSPVDWLGFPITSRSGFKLKTPPQYPHIVDDILKGEIEFYPTENAECPEVTTARIFRTLCELPYLRLKKISHTAFQDSIDRLQAEDLDPSLEKKVRYVFQRCIQNIRQPEAINRYVIGRNLSSYEKSSASLFRKWVPEILGIKEIEYRPKMHDPGDLRKEGLLIAAEDFLKKHTDNGVLYHGTRNRENSLNMLRGILKVSTQQEGRMQGRAVYGRGFYTTANSFLAQEYGDCVLKLQMTKAPQLRVLNLSLFKAHEKYLQFSQAAQKAHKDLHEFLCDEYDVDIILGDYPLIQNANVFSILKKVDSASHFFLKEAIFTNEKELVLKSLNTQAVSLEDLEQFVLIASKLGFSEILILLLDTGPISSSVRGKALIEAAIKGHTAVIEILLKNGVISEKDKTQAIFETVQKNHKEALEIFLRICNISKETRGRAVFEAAANNSEKVIEPLLKSGDISKEDRGLAVTEAAKQTAEKMMEILLENGPISEEDRGIAVINAASYGYEDLIEKLLQSGFIHKTDRDEAIFNANLFGHTKIARMLSIRSIFEGSRFDI